MTPTAWGVLVGAGFGTGLLVVLDHVLAEKVAHWPGHWKYQPPNFSKKILKETFAKDLPSDILRRGKQGFGVPIAQWFRGPLRSYLRETLLSPKAVARG